MKNLNPKPFIFILLVFSAIVWFIAASIRAKDLGNFLDLISLIPIVASVDLLAYWLFAQWGWRWKPLHGWLVPFPDLGGTWQGEVQTNWKDANGITPGPIPVVLAIKQSFGHISCIMRTGEMESTSFAEGFCIDKDNQVRKLCYSYTSKPKSNLRDRSTPHDGTMVFNIVGNPVHKLEGEYWTQRQTTGAVLLTLRTKELLDELPFDLPPHPLSQTRSKGNH